MKVYECFKRAQQLQRRAMKEKKQCTISIDAQPSEGLFAVIFLSDYSDDREDKGVFLLTEDGAASNHNELEMDKMMELYNEIPIPKLQNLTKESV
jgi:hypothetical protein